MNDRSARLCALALTLALLLGLTATPTQALDDGQLDAALADTAAYVCDTVSHPQVGSIGGEWAVVGLARSGCAVPEGYYQDYYAAVERYVEACGGVLHEKKYTEYSRVIVALAAIGKDARDVAGYDLTRALGDYEKTIWQGLNGPIWALIALDSRNYPMPQNTEAKTQATRQMYVERILTCQLEDGGWSLFGGTAAASSGDGVSDPDITGMALQALARYQDQPAVEQATEEALACMSARQAADGGFSSWGTANSESCVQMLVALCQLGLPLDDSRFVKNGMTLLDNLMTFYLPGKGFLHTADGSGSNLMATEQALYALAAAQRARDGRSSLYRMGDPPALAEGEGTQAGTGLAGKHPDIVAQPPVYAGKTFSDISDANAHADQLAIEALAARGILDGMGDGRFAPDARMTRAQFAAIVVRGLGFVPAVGDTFSDVPDGMWYAPYVGTAARYGLINGVSEGVFEPESDITRQQAAVLVTRAAAICGMDTVLERGAVRDVLAQFSDYTGTPAWTREGLAFCYAAGIFDDSALTIDGGEAILRCEIADMIYRLLGSANLL